MNKQDLKKNDIFKLQYKVTDTKAIEDFVRIIEITDDRIYFSGLENVSHVFREDETYHYENGDFNNHRTCLINDDKFTILEYYGNLSSPDNLPEEIKFLIENLANITKNNAII